MSASRTIALAVLSTTLGAASARADAISPPDVRCPAGTSAVSNHSGQWCAVTECAVDADCTRYGGQQSRCREIDLCVRTETYELGGNIAIQPGEPPPTGTRTVGLGPCGNGCVAPATCAHAKRCVDEGPLATGGHPASGGCGACAIAGRTGAPDDEAPLAAGVAFGLASLALTIVLTRRSRVQ